MGWHCRSIHSTMSLEMSFPKQLSESFGVGKVGEQDELTSSFGFDNRSLGLFLIFPFFKLRELEYRSA
jgi:hypothetical protein